MQTFHLKTAFLFKIQVEYKTITNLEKQSSLAWSSILQPGVNTAIGCVTMGKLLNSSNSQFLPYKTGILVSISQGFCEE